MVLRRHHCVRRERRRHYAREALGIGYESFDVEPPARVEEPPETAVTPTLPEKDIPGWKILAAFTYVMVIISLVGLILKEFLFRAK